MRRYDIDDSEDLPVDEIVPASRRLPMRAILLAVAIAVLAGGSWWAYRVDTARVPLSQVPVIRPDSAPVKEVPANPGGMVVPDQNSMLLNREGRSDDKIEELLPPPEPVLPRPVAPAPAMTGTSNAAAPNAPSPSATSSRAPPSPPPAPPASVVPAPAPPPAPVARMPATPPAVAKAPPPAAAPAVSLGQGYRLQLGALRSAAAATAAWQRLRQTEPDVLGRLNYTVSRIDLGGRGVFYRLQAGPIASEAAAERSCATLKSRHVGCILVKP